MFKNLLFYFYEKSIIVFIIILISISFSYHILLNTKVISNNAIYNYSNSDKINVTSNDTIKDTIYFRISDAKKFYNTQILINGEIVNDFKYNDEITISVYNNDIIDINGSMYNERFLVYVYYKSHNITSPNNNQEIVINSNMITAGKVKLN